MAYRRTEKVTRRLAARHDAIIAAAGALAAEHGMAAVQIAPVARRAGIAAGTVYRYFPAKTEMVAPLVADVPDDPAKAHAAAQMLTLFALRALGVVDARARGLVVQTPLPREPDGG